MDEHGKFAKFVFLTEILTEIWIGKRILQR